MRVPVVVTGLLLPWLAAAGASEVPLEAYGRLPTISMMALSPDGTRIAYRRTADGTDALIVQSLADASLVGGAQVSEINPRRITFLDDDHVLLFASEAAHVFHYRYEYEYSGSLLLDLGTGEVRQLLKGAREIEVHQSGLGRIIGHSRDRSELYMPAYLGGSEGRAARYGILKVDVASNTERIIRNGTVHTIDWLVDYEGNPLVEAEMDDLENVHRLYVRDGNQRRLLDESRTEIPITLVGLTPDLRSVVLPNRTGDDGFRTYYAMDFATGEEAQIFGRDDASVEHPLVGLDRVVHGVEFTGFLPSYGFFDAALQARVAATQEAMTGTAAYLVSWTPDFKSLLFELSGGWNSGAYVLVSEDSPRPRYLASKRPDIPSEAVVPTTIIEYEAGDGLVIPALLTAEPEVLEKGGASLVVLPHGGPESYDRFGFDWLAQYLASRGHAVLQPQFRGSLGFGGELRLAGHGEWGRKMSTDLDDGVRKLVEDGIVDAAHVCMVGGSYGGYAALAAGAFSTFDYKCLVSVNGVSDLRRMLRKERSVHGSNHWVVDYWKEQFGPASGEDEALEAISPAEHADAFRAPVLLLHGEDDTVVPIEQSERMERALERAGKEVRLVRLDGEDHWLSRGETRLEALRAIGAFIEQHL